MNASSNHQAEKSDMLDLYLYIVRPAVMLGFVKRTFP